MERPVGTLETDGAQSHVLNDAECNQILATVQIYARRNGLHRQDIDDIAQSLVVRLVSYLQSHPEKDPSAILSSAWLARATSNWTKNCRRAQWQQQNRELPLPTGSAEEQEGEAPPSPELMSNDPSLYTQTVRADFHLRLYNAIANSRLTPAQFDLLELFMNCESVTDIADRLNVRTDTIRHRLRRIWALLRSSLLRSGIGDAEVEAFLAGG